jgi:hypothetical protein
MRKLMLVVATATAVTGALSVVPGPAQAGNGRPAWHVSIAASTTTGTIGKKVRITGKVAAAAAGKLVVLQERPNADATWRNQRNAVVHRDGTYRTFDTPTANRSRMYRVVMPATPRHKKGVSRSVTVDVYAWVSLTTMPAVNDVSTDLNVSVPMNGVTFPSSLQARVDHVPNAPTVESVEYNLGHRCTRFRGTFGLSDDSESGSQATVTASADGTSWFSQTFGIGQSAANKIDFTVAPLKLRFESTSLVDGADGLGAVGTPEVFCTQ